MKLLMWFQTGKLAMVPLVANRFLEMMSELAVGWLLLEGAVIADEKAQERRRRSSRPRVLRGQDRRGAATTRATCCRASRTRRGCSTTRTARALDIPDAGFASI